MSLNQRLTVPANMEVVGWNDGIILAIAKCKGEGMEIITVESTKQLPSSKLVCYQLGKGYTEKEALEDYQEKYRSTPEQGWRWSTYLYFEVKK